MVWWPVGSQSLVQSITSQAGVGFCGRCVPSEHRALVPTPALPTNTLLRHFSKALRALTLFAPCCLHGGVRTKESLAPIQIDSHKKNLSAHLQDGCRSPAYQ